MHVIFSVESKNYTKVSSEICWLGIWIGFWWQSKSTVYGRTIAEFGKQKNSAMTADVDSTYMQQVGKRSETIFGHHDSSTSLKNIFDQSTNRPAAVAIMSFRLEALIPIPIWSLTGTQYWQVFIYDTLRVVNWCTYLKSQTKVPISAVVEKKIENWMFKNR